jgi:superfamily I DNA/RNA helicase
MPNFTAEQLVAVTSKQAGLRVSACPGSGKTTVLTERMARMLQPPFKTLVNGRYAYLGPRIKPKSALAITFTKKASAEMKTRLIAKVGEKARDVRIGTINSVCLEIIRKLTGTNPRQAAGKQIDLAIRAAAQEARINIRDAKVRITMAKAQGKMEDPVAKSYQAQLDKQGLIDFDDQLLMALDLLRTRDWSKVLPWRHILVDEAQDLNPIQKDIVAALASQKGATLFMVGDPDQAIYGFRGADSRLFIDNFPQLTHLRLSTNFRSGSALVSRASKLASDAFLPALETQGHLAWFEEADENSEANATVQRIKAEPAYKDVAVLTRTNGQALGIAIMLRQAGVPVLDEDNILDVKRYKHLKAIMTVIDDPQTNNVGAFFTAAGLADEFLGWKFKDAVEANRQGDMTLWEACQRPLPSQWMTKGAQKFRALVDHLRETYRRTRNVQITLREAAIKTRFMERFQMDEDDLVAILRLAANKTSIQGFIQAMTEFTAKMENGVRILTAHRAKGLEFPVVYVPGLNQGVFPHKRAHDYAEESRLLYVAITRAQKRLVLSWSATNPSQFLHKLGLPLFKKEKVFWIFSRRRRITTGFEGEQLQLPAAA